MFGVTGIPFSPSSRLNSRDFILSSLLDSRQDKISLEDNQEKILVSSARTYNLSNLFLLTVFRRELAHVNRSVNLPTD